MFVPIKSKDFSHKSSVRKIVIDNIRIEIGRSTEKGIVQCCLIIGASFSSYDPKLIQQSIENILILLSQLANPINLEKNGFIVKWRHLRFPVSNGKKT